MRLSLLLSCAAVFLAGCVNPGIVQVSQNTYVIERTDKGGIFGNASAMKADVIKESQEFADSKDMVAVPVAVKESPLQVMRSFASISYTFKLVDKSGSDPALAAIKEKCAAEYQNTLALDPIRQYVPLFISDATLSQRGSTKKPTAIEKGSLEVLDQVQADCRKSYIEYYAKNGAPPDVLALMKRNSSDQRALLMELWSGRLTYGQYNQKRSALADGFDSSQAKILNVERDRADARSDVQTQLSIAEQEARVRANTAQQAADAQSSMAATQRMILQNQQNQANKPKPLNAPGSLGNPIRTDCKQGMSGVECQTYSY